MEIAKEELDRVPGTTKEEPADGSEGVPTIPEDEVVEVVLVRRILLDELEAS